MGIDLGIVMDQGMVMKIRVGDKEMVMERSMVLIIRQGKERSIGHQVLKAIPIIPTIESGNLLSLHHQGGLVVAREVMMEMGVIRIMVTGKSIEVTNVIFEMKMKRRVIQKIHLNWKSFHRS